MKSLVSLTALGRRARCGTAQAQQISVKIGVMSDMSSLYADIDRPGLDRGGQAGDRRLHARPIRT